MSTYIQVNIYNQTLEVLKMRGLDLQSILKTIGCPDSWVTEVPIHPPDQRGQPTAPSADGVHDQFAAPNTSTLSIFSEKTRSPIKKPFKCISAEIGFLKPLNLINALKAKPSECTTVGEALQLKKTPKQTSKHKGLFDDWDPTASLDNPGTSSDVSSSSPLAISALKIPKEEVFDEAEEVRAPKPVEEPERTLIEDLLLRQQLGTSRNDAEESMPSKGRKKALGDEQEIPNINYVITCNYPGCGLQYNWRVKYGKLRLLDHALTHSNRKIPCKLCGFECTNVRRMRSHYAKAHPNERVEGYGMKALVSGEHSIRAAADGADGDHDAAQVSEDELKELWNTCYSEWIHLVGQASGFVDGEKYRRMTKRRKLEREAMNSMNFLF